MSSAPQLPAGESSASPTGVDAERAQLIENDKSVRRLEAHDELALRAERLEREISTLEEGLRAAQTHVETLRRQVAAQQMAVTERDVLIGQLESRGVHAAAHLLAIRAALRRLAGPVYRAMRRRLRGRAPR